MRSVLIFRCVESRLMEFRSVHSRSIRIVMDSGRRSHGFVLLSSISFNHGLITQLETQMPLQIEARLGYMCHFHIVV